MHIKNKNSYQSENPLTSVGWSLVLVWTWSYFSNVMGRRFIIVYSPSLLSTWQEEKGFVITNYWWHQHSVSSFSSIYGHWEVETSTLRMNVSLHIILRTAMFIHPSGFVMTVSRATQTPPLPFHLAKQKEAASLRSGSFQNSLSSATNSSAILNFLAFLTHSVYPAVANVSRLLSSSRWNFA